MPASAFWASSGSSASPNIVATSDGERSISPTRLTILTPARSRYVCVAVVSGTTRPRWEKVFTTSLVAGNGCGRARARARVRARTAGAIDARKRGAHLGALEVRELDQAAQAVLGLEHLAARQVARRAGRARGRGLVAHVHDGVALGGLVGENVAHAEDVAVEVARGGEVVDEQRDVVDQEAGGLGRRRAVGANGEVGAAVAGSRHGRIAGQRGRQEAAAEGQGAEERSDDHTGACGSCSVSGWSWSSQAGGPSRGRFETAESICERLKQAMQRLCLFLKYSMTAPDGAAYRESSDMTVYELYVSVSVGAAA